VKTQSSPIVSSNFQPKRKERRVQVSMENMVSQGALKVWPKHVLHILDDSRMGENSRFKFEFSEL